jgi:hypothetical protein
VEALEEGNKDNDLEGNLTALQELMKRNLDEAQRRLDREDKDEGNRPGY